MTPVHKDEVDGTILGERMQVRKSTIQEGRKFTLRHFARCHGEFLVLDLATAADVTIDGNVVRRIGDNHLRETLRHDRLVAISSKRIAAEQAVIPSLPEVALMRSGFYRDIFRLKIIGITPNGLRCSVE